MKKQTLNMIVKVIYASCLLGVTHSRLLNAADANIVSSLMEQANYWHGKRMMNEPLKRYKSADLENNNQRCAVFNGFYCATKKMKNKPAIGVKNWHGLYLSRSAYCGIKKYSLISI